MGRGLCTFLALVFVLVVGGRTATVRAEGFAPDRDLHTLSANVPAARSHDAAVPVFRPDDAVDRFAERDDDETWSPGDRDLWTTDFLYRPIEPAAAPWVASSMLGASPKLPNVAPLRC